MSIDSEITSLRRRTVVGVLKAWREVRGTARDLVNANLEPDLPKADLARLKEQMEECLTPKGGEVSARALTAELGRVYMQLNEVGRTKFLKLLATDFAPDEKAIEKAIAQYQKAAAFAEKTKAEAALREALTSPRVTILRQFTALPDGFKFLVDMRADAIALGAKDPALKALEADLKQILAQWFDVGLLDLVQITWHSPAQVLEKLIAYEAVHDIHSWDDLKNRLDSDRRIYAFFHSKMPHEPLIFVEVAFVEGLADNVQKLLDTDAPVLDIEKADTAIFYSISNAQKGLAGISFGNFLIKRVVNEITRNLPQIKTFATLSPVPGFRAWLDPLLTKGTELLKPPEAKALQALSSADWYKNKETAKALEPILTRLCAHYLVKEKKNERPLDPVASFHLFNGARLERINWRGDTSPKGMKQSAGMMVNYLYKLSEIDDNHEAFVREGKIAASRAVRGVL